MPAEAVSTGVSVGLGVRVARAVGVIEALGERVAEALGVSDSVAVRVCVGTMVGLGVGRPKSTPSRCAVYSK
jgi:hypothetical protein